MDSWLCTRTLNLDFADHGKCENNLGTASKEIHRWKAATDFHSEADRNTRTASYAGYHDQAEMSDCWSSYVK
jgi:hypothetical protein